MTLEEKREEMRKLQAKYKLEVDRSRQGQELERKGEIDEAIKLYELNINDNFEIVPYERLASIYRKRNQKEDEIRVLEKAVYVFTHIVYESRMDRLPKLKEFEKLLAEAKEYWIKR